MCLISSSRKSQIATEDIKVFKLAILSQGQYSSPYTEFDIGSPSEFPKTIVPKEPRFKINKTDQNTYLISSGSLHAYTHLSTAINKICLYRLSRYCLNLKILECHIPKGARYFVNYNGKEICSRKLIIDKEHVPSNK
jgi:hypothetical protein